MTVDPFAKQTKAFVKLGKQIKRLATIGPVDILSIIELISAFVQLLTALKPLMEELGVGIADLIVWIKTVWPNMTPTEQKAMLKGLKKKFEKAALDQIAK